MAPPIEASKPARGSAARAFKTALARPTSRLGLSSARLAVLYVVIFAIGISVLLTTVYFLTARVLDREVEAVIQAEMSGLVDDYRQGGLLELIQTLHLRANSWGRSGAVYLLVNPDDTRVAGNLARWPTDVEVNGDWLEFDIDASEHGGVVAHPVRAQVLRLPGARRLLVGTDILERKRLASRLRYALIWGTSLCVALATLISLGYSQRVRRRIEAIAETCETIMSGDLSQRLAVEGSNDEFDELSDAVNLMLERIEQQTDVLRTTFDSAAHDLRAPLYRARVRIEESMQHDDISGSARETMEATLAELDRVQRTLGTLLQIAQADGRSREVPADPVEVADLAREIVELYRPEAGGRNIALDYSGSAAATLRGNGQLLAQALVNLVENALKYVPAGGRVGVQVLDAPDSVTLAVDDNGPGIPEGDRERVLQPFARLDRDRLQVGSGLGLSLVAAVMRLHRGSVELADNAPGLIVRCTIPKGRAASVDQSPAASDYDRSSDRQGRRHPQPA
jgi:signal transduction histidine kinase